MLGRAIQVSAHPVSGEQGELRHLWRILWPDSRPVEPERALTNRDPLLLSLFSSYKEIFPK